MPRTPEEKTKCQEKLSQMEKYLPFIEFMINKIKKKNETSLDCQLNKFQVLRSMIVERSEHYTLEVLIKVEQIIEKLISKLGYKEDVKNSNATLEVKDIKSTNLSDSASGSRLSSSPNSVHWKIQAEAPKCQNFCSSNDDVITESLEINSIQKVGKDPVKPLEEKSKCYLPRKILGTDLDKDLDGFDLTYCFNVSERMTKSLPSSDSAGSEKASQDLLTSSREKLLKSLQNRLFPKRVEHTSPPFSGSKTNCSSNGETSIKSSDQNSKCGNRRGSVETNERIVSSNDSTKNKILEKSNLVSSKSVKAYGQIEKLRSDADSSEINLKQKLKEKLSTDICEVHRVPGKSVGGSLRLLKDSKDHKKNNFLEENDLFKPDMVTKINVPSRGSSSCLQQPDAKDKCRQDCKNSELKIEKSSDKSSQNFSASVKNKQAFKHSKLNEFKNNKSNTSLDKKSSNKYDQKDVKEDKTEKTYEMNELNDDELTEFVKENIQHLPHLAKLKPAELRKTVESTFVDCTILSDVEIVSDDSLQEFDEFLSNASKSPSELKLTALSPSSKSKNKERHPLASLKIAGIDADSAPKNINPGTDGKVSEGAGDKIHDSALLPSVDEEDDYAIKLIEETTPKNVPVKKKQSLLDLPIPDTTDLFDDITSIESFESSKSPKEIRDPRLKKLENEKKSNKIESSSQLNQNSYPLPSFAVKPQEGFTSAILPVDNNFGETQGKEQRLDEKPLMVPYLSEDPSGYSNNLSKEVKNPYSEAHKSSKDPRLLAHNPPVPKSYAEYKRMKLQEQKTLARCGAPPPPQITQKFCDNNISENFHSFNDKDSIKPDLIKTSKKCSSNQKNSNQRSAKSKRAHKRKTLHRRIRRLRENYQEEKRRHENEQQKIAEEKRRGAESEESTSPLEKLYQTENKPKTGRGYGIQNFKIPKKFKTPVKKQAAVVADVKKAAAVIAKSVKKEEAIKETNNIINDPQILGLQNELNSSKTITNKVTMMDTETTNSLQEKTDATVTMTELKKEKIEENQIGVKAASLNSESSEDINNRITAEENQEIENKGDSQTVHDPKVVVGQPQSEVGCKIDSGTKQLSVCEPIQNTENDIKEQADTNVQSKSVEVEPVKKYEPEIVECDSSVENSTLNGAMPAKDNNTHGEKSVIISKEEITQEFVEALIRKSFESGQGKLLLAQAKLFEELGRKLNSKKLKTIQKIINSESDSSSSSSESSSSNEKKKKKSKRSKKPKKKAKKSRRLVISSSSSTSSSSSESEETGEEKNNRKKKKSDSPETQDKVNNSIPLEETETKKNDLAIKPKSKTKKKRFDYPSCFSRKRNKRKQQQNKLIAKIMNEAPANSEEISAKEQESKTKPKPKSKVKTELDKLHEDIKNMFISSGVITATGQRMCRILRNSGGKVDSLDIVKESAKMVEEEKLKKVQSNSRNPRPRNATDQDSRSRSQSLDKYQDRLNDYDQDPKLKSAPYVLLQKVDLNNFGYGVKISDDCISFYRVRGRNTALRGFKTLCRSIASKQTSESPSKNLFKGIFLARNKRKYERLSGKMCKTSYVKKKLMDIVRNLPLKMAKIKHLQFSEKKNDDTRKKKVAPEKLEKKMARLGEAKQFRDDDLMNHAFELRKSCYRCKVCSRNFRNITEHYKTVHPEHEVLISRLCQKEATKAKFDAVKNNYEDPSKEPFKRNAKTGPFSYQCRMCSLSRTNDVNVFFTHVTSHTGELRFQCPNEGCAVQTANGEEVKFHILTKHPKNRYDLYNKIIELYPSPIEGCQLFGFLCSKCNFVQLSRRNMDAHISKQHPSDEIKIFKINMSSDSSNRSKIKRAVMKNNKKNSEQLLRPKTNEKKTEVLTEPVISSHSSADSQMEVDVAAVQEQKSRCEEEENSGKDVTDTIKTVPDKSEVKVMETDKSTQVSETEEAAPSKNTFVEEPVEVNVVPGTEENNAELFGNKGRIIETLEVGPLKSLLLENSEMYFKCRVQNCGIIRKGFEKFEGHLTFKHCRKKWSGICLICSVKVPNDLLSALKHLKFHLIKSKFRESAEKFIPNDTETQSGKVVTHALVHSKEGIQCDQEMKDAKYVGKLYPTKPLLKVRNLLGDRLSTPKEPAHQNEIITIAEEEGDPASKTNKMFTIENVRSLKSEVVSDVTDNNQESVCVVTDQHPGGSQVGPGKVILVRSCPTRKIAIRPENNPVSLDVGQFNLVQTPVPTHPVMLGPVPAGTPIHLLSPLQPVCQNSMIAIKPVMVTNSAAASSATFKSNSNIMPIVRPASTSAAILPVSATSETSETTLKSTPNETSNKSLLIKSKRPLEITVCMPPSEPESPPAAVRTFSENSNSEEQEEKELITPLRIFTSIGSKVVKDAAIYKQMLTKTKLCHLFKCMAVECSFTCNSENIFTRHLGLHEAQRRIKKKQGLKESFPQSKKSHKTFQWQQCAYCCQILNQTDNALSRHIVLEHGHCTYQCAYCFYRAVSQSYVEIHQNLVHNQILMVNARVIYKCKPLAAFASQPSALEKRCKRQSVRPYVCDQCGKNFYVIQEFLTHLTTEHQTVTAYTCHICKNLSFKANRLINHYKLHSYCTYQCAYCLHGTETELEMVFHLCNFHFSQPAVMYLRALPEGVESKGITQLDSMKVVVYENDSLNEDCITEVDVESEEESTYDPLKESVDFSEIVAELGINSDDQSECEVMPLLKELASLSDYNAKDLNVKTLLPNAQFSSENDNSNEGCSVLISSGVSVASTQNDEKEMSIPLGQLPLEALNIKHVQHTPKTVEPPKKSPNLNEGIISRKAKETSQSFVNKEEEKTSEPSTTPCVHNLPQVLLTRTFGPKNVYPSKRLAVAKKPSEDSSQTEGKPSVENTCAASYEIVETEGGQVARSSKNKSINVSSGENIEKASIEKDFIPKENIQPLITSVVSLSESSFENKNTDSPSSVGEDITVSKIVINVHSDVNSTISVKNKASNDENLQIDDSSQSLDTNPELVIDDTSVDRNNGEEEEVYLDPKSPDVIIIKEGKRSKDIETVTIDSDDEKDAENLKSEAGKSSISTKELSDSNGGIRKEMEMLRHQMANETDSLLFDDSKENKSVPDVAITLIKNQCYDQPKDILSPIEEAISSLNKKLESETTATQESGPKINDKAKEKISDQESIKTRTRFGSRDRKKECNEEKNEEESKKEESNKNKKVRKELFGLFGKELYICGNEQCTFAAENNSALKDHLYVCDFSRLSSVLMCPHCSKHFKQCGPYLEHLKYHGEKKYHCGLCSFSSAVESAALKHLKQKHKCHVTKSVPKEPPKEDHIVFYPKNHKIDKIDFEENGYSPGDENKLPLQSVYQVNVKCAKCPYFTKVRSNMVRHLKIHVKSAETEGVIVPSTAPTNPVPCLETKEKMFDKMTNLAASSQLAQAEKEKVTALPPEVEAKFPQYVAEQLRFKCCLSDCNYITVDDRMLKHHIKALHNEVTHYSCPHCRSTVHLDMRKVTLEKIGHHLKFHDSKLYKCGYCIYIHYQKNFVEKHSCEKHADRRCFVQMVRDSGAASEEEHSGSEIETIVWKCARCQDFQCVSKSKLRDHLLNEHKIKSSYQCKHCSMTGNGFKMFASHFASKHPGEEVAYTPLFYEQKVPSSKLGSLSGNSSGADSSNEHFDTTPLWQRGAPRVRHIRGILIEEEEVKSKKIKRWSVEEAETTEPVSPKNKGFYCPLCSDKKKVFFTKSEDFFRTHLYQELNYQQFACILCGKMFVNKKDFEKHHARTHPDKPPEMNQTKEDGEIIFWVDKVIAKQRQQMNEKKRKLSDLGCDEGSSSPKKKKEQS